MIYQVKAVKSVIMDTGCLQTKHVKIAKRMIKIVLIVLTIVKIIFNA